MSPECAGFAREPAKLEDQVRFLAATLWLSVPRWNGGVPWQDATITTRPFFVTMSKRRRGFPSATRVKRGVRIVNSGKLLEEKLGRNDLCPCGSGRLFKKCCLRSGRF
ncbi:MAG: SEC-C metal-binding domain-containing protein [Pirellulaceae bacterium]